MTNPHRTRTFRCPPDHKHEMTCYNMHGCGCDDCRGAQNAYNRARRKGLAYNRWETIDWVDATPVRGHIRVLVALGHSERSIAARAGVGGSTIQHILHGMSGREPARRVKRATAERILALPASRDTAPDAVYDRNMRGVIRRIQALYTRGWSAHAIADYAGLGHEAVRQTLNSGHGNARTVAGILAAYEDLWNKTAPTDTAVQRRAVSRVLHTAQAHGWLPPLAWDDIDEDEEPPTVEKIPAREYVDELVIDLVLEGAAPPRHLTSREAEILVTALHARKYSDKLIGEMTGITERNVLRIRARLGLPGIPKEEQRSNLEQRSYDMAHRAGLEKAA